MVPRVLEDDVGEKERGGLLGPTLTKTAILSGPESMPIKVKGKTH